MRNGSAAIVPLLIAVMLVFWFISFMGGESDNLHTLNEVKNLQRVQEKLLLPAIKYHYKLQQEVQTNGATVELNQQVNQYVNNMMVLNDLQPASTASSSGDAQGDTSAGTDSSSSSSTGGNASSNANDNGSASSNAGTNGNMGNNGGM